MRKLIALAILVMPALVAAEQTCVIDITGMTCNGCVTKVKSALEKVNGVISADVTLQPPVATVSYLDDKVGEEVLLEAISNAGYKGSLRTAAASALPQQKDQTSGEAGDVKAISGAIGTPAAPVKAVPHEHVCPHVKGCKELIDFHSAMHPMAVALGYEGGGKPDYKRAISLYPKLKSQADKLAAMPVDDKVTKDREAFIAQRNELVKSVDELGKACSDKDNARIVGAFEKVHDGYVKLALLAN